MRAVKMKRVENNWMRRVFGVFEKRVCKNKHIHTSKSKGAYRVETL